MSNTKKLSAVTKSLAKKIKCYEFRVGRTYTKLYKQYEKLNLDEQGTLRGIEKFQLFLAANNIAARVIDGLMDRGGNVVKTLVVLIETEEKFAFIDQYVKQQQLFGYEKNRGDVLTQEYALPMVITIS